MTAIAAPEKTKVTITKPTTKRTPPRLLYVVNTKLLGPNMKRVYLSSAALKGFPVDKNGAHIKIFLPRKHQLTPVLPTIGPNGVEWPSAEDRPITRTYSVRKYCPITNTLEVDFVLHGTRSPASGWAHRAKIGDAIGVAGPGGPSPLLAKADWHILVGDSTALPAISAIAETLPKSAKGHVVILSKHRTDALEICAPLNMTVHWLNVPIKHAVGSIVPLVNSFEPPAGATVSAFIGGENSVVVQLRDILRHRFNLTKRTCYAIPYWRYGQDEETYHQQRHKVMDEEY